MREIVLDEDARTLHGRRPSAHHATVLCEQCDLPYRHYPDWLKIVSHLNPLTYVVDALRTLMLAGSASSFGLCVDYAVILITTTVLVLIGARLYPRLAT